MYTNLYSTISIYNTRFWNITSYSSNSVFCYTKLPSGKSFIIHIFAIVLNSIVIIPATLQRCCNNEFKFFPIEQQTFMLFYHFCTICDCLRSWCFWAFLYLFYFRQTEMLTPIAVFLVKFFVLACFLCCI
jgi:hypothetical protein